MCARRVVLVMEFVEHDLRTLSEDMRQPFAPSEVKTLMKQLLSAVDFLHSNFIMHRDLKTSNVLLNNRGHAKIADFGMARSIPPPRAPLTQLVVTLWYRAPELLLGTTSYGTEIDMWSLGCIFGELIQKEPLFPGKNEVDEVTRIFALCGLPNKVSWPEFFTLPNARSLKYPTNSNRPPVIRSKFPTLTNAGADLLTSLLSLNPSGRPTAKEALQHKYFEEKPWAKQPDMFPTFPSKAGQERRKRWSPSAPVRGEAPGLGGKGEIDFSGIFTEGRAEEHKGAGFTLRMA
jgi:cell division cycle 2-like